MPAFKDLTGKQFSRLTVIRRVENKRKNVQWLCRCTCGKFAVVTAIYLTTGDTKSCGCLNIERARNWGHSNRTHGMVNTRIYNSWRTMKQRCNDPNDISYSRYGGRGITVCQRWKNSFENFMQDMGLPPSDRHSLERINTDGNYEPSNCRWATAKEQSNNRRNNHIIECFGESMTIKQWSERIGIHPDTLRKRLLTGWSEEEALTTPLEKHTRRQLS